MPRGGYARKRLWRWRANPLRRREDVAEAWIVLTVWTVFTVGGTAAGLVTAGAADNTFARERAERQPVTALVVRGVPATATVPRGTSGRLMTSVRWTAPDGSSRTGRTLVDTGTTAGSPVTVWQDGRGRLSPAPPTPTQAAVESGVLGTASAAALAGLVFGAGAAAKWSLDRRRLDAWGREWSLVEPGWGHRTP
ncbi:Rv1733c family protein [Streptomyces aureus]|uniref:Rv1733c family protein n=1 Tax=Streptomyces aureus TaxID=193461 RepID=UPI0033D9FC4B